MCECVCVCVGGGGGGEGGLIPLPGCERFSLFKSVSRWWGMSRGRCGVLSGGGRGHDLHFGAHIIDNSF